MARSPGRSDAQAPRRASAAQNPKSIFGVWRFDRCDRFRHDAAGAVNGQPSFLAESLTRQ